MENNKSVSIELYWIYFTGFFLALIQLLNVIPPWFTPTEWGKSIIFRIIISVLFSLLICQILLKKANFQHIKEKIKSVKLPIYILFSFFGINLLSAFFSVDPQFSLWGNPFRAGGVVNLGFYIIWALIVFLIIKAKDWKKLLNFSVIIGWIVCIIAFIQQFELLPKIITGLGNRPMSVMANPILLSIYLLLLTFFPIAFGMEEKNKNKKIFYFSSSLLFLFVSVIFTQTRGTFLGIAAGIIFFVISQLKTRKRKLYALAAIVLFLVSAFRLKIYLDRNLYIYNKIPPILSSSLDRALSLFEGGKVAESRISTWKVAFRALKDKPILGYGPENFMVAFDKFYDPSLPKISQIAPGENPSEWFDRPHNIVLDIANSAGILALLAYISFFIFLIYLLQKAKKNSDSPIFDALSATFIAYFISLLFAFDSASTLISFFLLVGYSLFLISKSSHLQIGNIWYGKLNAWNWIGGSAVALFLCYFIMAFNISPLSANTKINYAMAFSQDSEITSCSTALKIINESYPLSTKTIINNYLDQKSTFVIYQCTADNKISDISALLSQAIKILEKTCQDHPGYTTNWMLLGEYKNLLIEENNKKTDNVFIDSDENQKLKQGTELNFKKALELSPNRQLLIKDLAKTYMITGDYQKADEQLSRCIDLNPSYSFCYWYIALNKGYQKNYEAMEKAIILAKEKGYEANSIESLQQLVNVYIRNNDYNGLAQTYPLLIDKTENSLSKAQLYASLAASFKEIGDIKKAREQVLKIRDLIPFLPKDKQQAVENDVQNFLEVLK